MTQIVRASPLVGAELRVKRARQSIGTLKRQGQRWANAHAEFIAARQDKVTGTISLVLTPGDATPLARMAITSGETLYNLRAALDYIVYDLAAIHTRTNVLGTQFPIEDSSETFEGRVTGRTEKGKQIAHYLKGVPPTAVSLIRKLQPFEGCAWTGELRDLSNPDKHRALASLRSNVVARVKSAQFSDVDPETGKRSLGIKYDAEVELFFVNGLPVQETLEAFHREVKATAPGRCPW